MFYPFIRIGNMLKYMAHMYERIFIRWVEFFELPYVNADADVLFNKLAHFHRNIYTLYIVAIVFFCSQQKCAHSASDIERCLLILIVFHNVVHFALEHL